MKRCYMIFFESGLLKVGYANPLYYRVKEHKRQAEIHGNKVKRIWFSEPISDYAFCEQKMIMECSKSFSKVMDEYFVDANEDICEFILKQTGIPFSKCNDIAPSQSSGSFFALVQDDKSGDKEAPREDEKIEKPSEAMVKVVKILSSNKVLSDGVIKNRLRKHSKASITKALVELEAMGKISVITQAHKRTGIEFKSYALNI